MAHSERNENVPELQASEEGEVPQDKVCLGETDQTQHETGGSLLAEY